MRWRLGWTKQKWLVMWQMCALLALCCHTCVGAVSYVNANFEFRNRCNWRVGVNIAQADCVQDKVVLEVALGISGWNSDCGSSGRRDPLQLEFVPSLAASSWGLWCGKVGGGDICWGNGHCGMCVWVATPGGGNAIACLQCKVWADWKVVWIKELDIGW